MSDNITFEFLEQSSTARPSNKPDNDTDFIRSDGESNTTILTKIQEYNRVSPLHVVIMTPCYGSQCYVNYVTCLMNTVTLFTSAGIKLKVEFCRNDSLVSRARNNLIAKAMSDPTTTHALFIDADISWSAIDIFKLILAKKPIVGGIYPIKNYDWKKLTSTDKNVAKGWIDTKNASQLKSVISDEDFVQHKMMRYNLNYLSNTLEITNNLTRIRHLATGFMMIRRDTIEKMCRAFPSTKYVDDVGFLSGTENDHAFALFDCGVEDGHYCSEDWLFCTRWTKMGGEIWADVTINLNHTGIEDFKGSFIASLM